MSDIVTIAIIQGVITVFSGLAVAFIARNTQLKVGHEITKDAERIRLGAARDLEGLKKDIQLEVEKQKNRFQTEMEVQRQEFQRALDTDRQHMELYKTLYSARLTAAMKLSELTGDLYIVMTTRLRDMDAATMKTAVHPGLDRLANWRNSSDWLFTKEVNDAASAFIRHALEYANTSNIGIRDHKIDEMGEAHRQLSDRIREMMLSDDLSRLVKK